MVKVKPKDKDDEKHDHPNNSSDGYAWDEAMVVL